MRDTQRRQSPWIFFLYLSEEGEIDEKIYYTYKHSTYTIPRDFSYNYQNKIKSIYIRI